MYSSSPDVTPEPLALSFKQNRAARKASRLQQQRRKAALHPRGRRVRSMVETSGGRSAIGPTPETVAKLTPDPLVVFQRRHILNDPQIGAFRLIRRAVQLITDGTQVRVSHMSDVVVQTSRFAARPERDHEIRLKDRYCAWVDRMTAARMSVGPILDIILDEKSLAAVDRKWGRRKGWAKSHLQAGLDLYHASYSKGDRHE